MTVWRLGDLAEAVGARLAGDPELRIHGVGSLDKAKQGEISFFSNPKYRDFLQHTQASAVILRQENAEHCAVALLFSDNPYLTYAKVARLLFPEPEQPAGRHDSAVVAATARIDPSACLGPGVVVGEGVEVGAGAYVGPGCVVEQGCVVGERSRLLARVTLCQGTLLGKRCLIHPGAVIGSDGFGLADEAGRWVKVPQLGRVRVGDDVEIGANCTIDRGTLDDTVLEDGVKLDNLVHIAHNVQVGAHTAMAAASAVAGSTKIGRHCTVGGMTGIAGHLTIGDNVHFTGASQVTRSFKEAGYFSGNLPAMENAVWRKAVARIRQLDDIVKRLKTLEKMLSVKEGDQDK